MRAIQFPSVEKKMDHPDEPGDDGAGLVRPTLFHLDGPHSRAMTMKFVPHWNNTTA
jgi:hypothetical protein